MTTYTVITQHGEAREVREVAFLDYTSAETFAQANTPDTDPTMVPSLDEGFDDLPTYERGMYWLRNKYAIITKN